MAVYFHEEDLPEGVLAEGAVAVDTETMGLITRRDRLCLVQISDGKGDEHLVRFGVAARERLREENVAESAMAFARAVDLRYEGQEYSIAVPIEDGDMLLTYQILQQLFNKVRTREYDI